MKNLSKQVVILDNISSPYIHQAIIILKSYPAEQHDKIISEAEKIVSSYFDRRMNESKNNGNKNVFGLKCAVILLSIALTISIILSFVH